jgi:hypothetical protein
LRGCAGIDLDDLGVGIRRADELDVQCAGWVDVVHVSSTADHELAVVLALDGLTDQAS